MIALAVSLTLLTATGATGATPVKSKATKYRFYVSCYNKSCSMGMLLKVYSNHKVQGIYIPANEWGCLSGRVNYVTEISATGESKLKTDLTLGSDYAWYPNFGNYEIYNASGTWPNMKIDKVRHSWQGPIKGVNQKKHKTLKKYFNKCAKSHKWKKIK